MALTFFPQSCYNAVHKIEKREDLFGTRLFSGLKYKRPLVWTAENGNPMDEVCILHRAPRTWEQQE